LNCPGVSFGSAIALGRTNVTTQSSEIAFTTSPQKRSQLPSCPKKTPVKNFVLSEAPNYALTISPSHKFAVKFDESTYQPMPPK
jgi:hypothetical protein